MNKSFRLILVLALLIVAASVVGAAAFHNDPYPASSPGGGENGAELADNPFVQDRASEHCAPLPPPSGNLVHVSSESELWGAVNAAQEDDTILLADGAYNLGQNGHYVWIDTPNVTLRSASGNRDAVILDDNYLGTEIISVLASNVTIADITIKRAQTHPIHVMSSNSGDTLNTLIYNVHIIDPGQQAIKINPHSARVNFPDYGKVACSHLELTSAGRAQVLEINGSCYTGGVDAHAAQGWEIRDNVIEGFWCDSGGLAEHGIHMWSDSSDTLVERNLLIENARGIGFGLGSSGHVGGIIRNNMVYVMQDVGIGLESSPNTRVYNNTVYTENYFNSIEYRFAASSGVEIINNLTNQAIASREGGSGMVQNNVTDAETSWFVDATAGDLHLASESIPSVIDQGETLADVWDDYDGDGRPQGAAYDIGADELASVLILTGAPADRSIHLNWRVNSTIPATSTWQIAYDGPPGTEPSPVIGIVSPTRSYALTELTNYVWYSVTLNAMVDTTPILTDTVMVMPTDRFVYLPLVSQQ